MNPLPYAPDHHDPAVVARQRDLEALLSQVPGIYQRHHGPRYCQCGHTATMHALHADDHPCRNCECDMYQGSAA